MSVICKVQEVLTLGGDKLAVDGVILIGEHGDYPVNDKAQTLYPRFEMFLKIRTFELVQSGDCIKPGRGCSKPNRYSPRREGLCSLLKDCKTRVHSAFKMVVDMAVEEPCSFGICNHVGDCHAHRCELDSIGSHMVRKGCLTVPVGRMDVILVAVGKHVPAYTFRFFHRKHRQSSPR